MSFSLGVECNFNLNNTPCEITSDLTLSQATYNIFNITITGGGMFDGNGSTLNSSSKFVVDVQSDDVIVKNLNINGSTTKFIFRINGSNVLAENIEHYGGYFTVGWFGTVVDNVTVNNVTCSNAVGDYNIIGNYTDVLFNNINSACAVGSVAFNSYGMNNGDFVVNNSLFSTGAFILDSASGSTIIENVVTTSTAENLINGDDVAFRNTTVTVTGGTTACIDVNANNLAIESSSINSCYLGLDMNTVTINNLLVDGTSFNSLTDTAIVVFTSNLTNANFTNLQFQDIAGDIFTEETDSLINNILVDGVSANNITARFFSMGDNSNHQNITIKNVNVTNFSADWLIVMRGYMQTDSSFNNNFLIDNVVSDGGVFRFNYVNGGVMNNSECSGSSGSFGSLTGANLVFENINTSCGDGYDAVYFFGYPVVSIAENYTFRNISINRNDTQGLRIWSNASIFDAWAIEGVSLDGLVVEDVDTYAQTDIDEETLNVVLGSNNFRNMVNLGASATVNSGSVINADSGINLTGSGITINGNGAIINGDINILNSGNELYGLIFNGSVNDKVAGTKLCDYATYSENTYASGGSYTGLNVGFCPKITEFSSTTDFENLSDWSNVTLTLENSYGEIAYNNSINLSGTSVDFDSNVEIEQDKITVDSVAYPELNDSAVLTYENIDTISGETIAVYKNFITGLLASFGLDFFDATYTRSSGTYEMTVITFSSYELKYCSDTFGGLTFKTVAMLGLAVLFVMLLVGLFKSGFNKGLLISLLIILLLIIIVSNVMPSLPACEGVI